MRNMPDDMLFYFNTIEGKTLYFSVHYSVRHNVTHIVEIEMDELWELVNEGGLQLTEFSPLDFPHDIPGNISGNVKAFII